jgi:mycothiol synthase
MPEEVQRFAPQLCMKRHTLDDLPEIELPPGYTIRTSQDGDGPHWGRIIRESFGMETIDDSHFERHMKSHPSFRPDRVFFICGPDGVPCGTASAFQFERFGPSTGYLHFVGVCPAHAGKRLGFAASLAALHRFRSDGFASAALQTDDFRLSAIKTYLRLGFVPVIVNENQTKRWDVVLGALELPVAGKYVS